MFSAIIDACRTLLADSEAAKDCQSYLDGRLSRTIQERFGFGYFPNQNNLPLLTAIIGEDVLLQSKLLYQWDVRDSQSARIMGVSFFEHHPLVMPYRDLYGRVVAIVGRSLLNDKEREAIGVPKYKNTVFTKGSHLFGLNDARNSIIKEDKAYVVEGQFDMIKAFEKGITNVVAVGNSNITGYQLGLLRRYTNNIVLLFDTDEAGRMGADKAMGKFKQYANLRDVCLPAGYKDFDEFLGENGIEELNALI